ncbi:hypothetical protein [Mesorhizobium sp. CA7]|uniref:hypothetical protein n=1 Tax=Mesorhizobium sp. CA7 TaxID=588501 RepID=UPI001CC926F2|nr:hypothetical protein [Mesorhizobium sp. CA7]MBZ9816709.1 hypothetical protein [Mesorhizobium sp. CA7]
MADNDTSTTNSANGNAKTAAARPTRTRPASRSSARASRASEDAMKKQIAELKREVNRLNRTLSEQAGEAAETAHGWYRGAADRASNLYSGASDRASRAASQLRSQAQSVSETVQQNPGTFSTAMLIGGLVGLLAGMAISRSSAPEPDWLHRWHR